MRALVLSAYDAGSHAYWRHSLTLVLPQWEIHSLCLPPRHFSWRVRGNPLFWSREERAVLTDSWDAVIATSMVDLATLRGLVPALAQVPSLYYFHENQFAYPPNGGKHGVLEAQMVSLYGALAADALAFNSQYNRDSFLEGVETLLGRLPDYVPAGLGSELRSRSHILPVALRPVESSQASRLWTSQVAGSDRPLRLLWSGRLEYDRGGEGLESILPRLEEAGLNFELAIAGQEFRQRPEVFDRIARRWGRHIVHWGWLDQRAEYLALLSDADVVLSTSRHEFQGIAVAEAVQYGCYPILPRRLVYPELYPESCLYAPHEDIATEARGAAQLILASAPAILAGHLRAPDLARLELPHLAPVYQHVLAGLRAAG